MAEVKWKMSNNGKTVTVGGKTYTLTAFKSQFQNALVTDKGGKWSGPGMFEPGNSGIAQVNPKGPSVRQVKVSDGPEAAKKRYEKKAAKKVTAEMTKKGVGNKLTGKTPKSPTRSSTGKTTVSGMANARYSRIVGAGGLFGAFSTKQVR